MNNKLMILTQPRSGSEFLCTTLSRCMVSCRYPIHESSETINFGIGKQDNPNATRFTYFNDKFGRDHKDDQEILDNAINIQEEYFKKYDIAKIFKSEWCMPHNSEYWNWLSNHSHIKTVHLIRNNTLRRFVSHTISQKTGIWHTEKPLNLTRIDINIPLLFDYIKLSKEEDEWVKTIFHSAYNIYYDDIVRDIKDSVKNLLKWAKILIGVLEIPMLKQTNPFDLRSIIINYDDVYSVLKGTDDFWMLDIR